MSRKAEGMVKRWWKKRKQQSRAEYLYGWRGSVSLVVLLLLPHVIMGWTEPAHRYLLLGVWIVLVGVLLYLRWLVPYKPIKGVRLRRMKMHIDWHQIHRWFKQKHVRAVWHDVGYIRVEPGKPPMIVVGEKYAYHQGVAEKAEALLA